MELIDFMLGYITGVIFCFAVNAWHARKDH